VIRDSKITAMLLCALAVPAMPVAAQEAIGRLFFTPSQRASLDVARSQRARATLATERTEEQAAPAAQTITYGGMVRRSDGKSTVWINNRPVHDNEPAGSAVVGRVRPDGSVSLQVPQSGRSVELKPGQSIELLSGAIEESYSRRSVQQEGKPASKPATEPQRAGDTSGRSAQESPRGEPGPPPATPPKGPVP
jgi:hypothetical protein